MKRLFIVAGLLSTWTLGFCTLQDTYNLSQNQAFLQRVEAAIVTAALNVVSEVANDVQTVTITGSPTGGTFTLTYGGTPTAPIAWNAVAGTVQSLLYNVTGNGNVVVTGGPAPATPFTVTFVGSLSASPLSVMTTTSTFTGGSSPASSVTHTTIGQGFVNHSARLNFASKVLANPVLYAALLAVAVATNATVQSDFPGPSYNQSGSVTTAQADNDIQFQVNSVFNSYI